ncbi:MAG: MmgE/PrpD family protein [Candidatus Lambdaproteobacteria bacterium]|nr:MmgE/PrpD family protein [Candidatus Lambdaproteobacteria bacterium]
MSSLFLQRLIRLIVETPAPLTEALPIVVPAFEDTLAVTLAGWHEPPAQGVIAAHGWEGTPPLLGPLSGVAPRDIAPRDAVTTALVWGTAAHALDYDDVHMTSSTHPSAVIVPALLAALGVAPEAVRGPAPEAARGPAPEAAPRLAGAFAVGLATNVALGRVLGFPHYEKGWHATSTIGPMAAAAALAHLFALDATEAAHALALAAAQAGGLQRNFGAMAKPVQAGLAAGAAVRAALMARAGVTGDSDPFGPKGYFDLYAGAKLSTPPDEVTPDLAAGGISVKLYPCCYLAHRPIGAAIELRQRLHERGVAPAALSSIEVRGPQGAFIALRVTNPRIGSEGKFCGPYAVACALLDGTVTLGHFEDDAVRRPDLRALLDRTVLKEEPRGSAAAGSLSAGSVRVVAFDAKGRPLAQGERATFPGSPESPPTAAEREAKLRDCLEHYGRHGQVVVAADQFRARVAGLFPTRAEPGTAQAHRARAG